METDKRAKKTEETGPVVVNVTAAEAEDHYHVDDV